MKGQQKPLSRKEALRGWHQVQKATLAMHEAIKNNASPEEIRNLLDHGASFELLHSLQQNNAPLGRVDWANPLIDNNDTSLMETILRGEEKKWAREMAVEALSHPNASMEMVEAITKRLYLTNDEKFEVARGCAWQNLALKLKHFLSAGFPDKDNKKGDIREYVRDIETFQVLISHGLSFSWGHLIESSFRRRTTENVTPFLRWVLSHGIRPTTQEEAATTWEYVFRRSSNRDRSKPFWRWDDHKSRAVEDAKILLEHDILPHGVMIGPISLWILLEAGMDANKAKEFLTSYPEEFRKEPNHYHINLDVLAQDDGRLADVKYIESITEDLSIIDNHGLNLEEVFEKFCCGEDGCEYLWIFVFWAAGYPEQGLNADALDWIYKYLNGREDEKNKILSIREQSVLKRSTAACLNTAVKRL